MPQKEICKLGAQHFMRQKNRLEALSSFGISAETIKEIDRKMAVAGKKYKNLKEKWNFKAV